MGSSGQNTYRKKYNMHIKDEEKNPRFFQKSKMGVARQKKTCERIFFFFFLIFIWTNRHALVTLKTYISPPIISWKRLCGVLCTFDSNYPKNSQYLVNRESNQKSVTNEKDAHFHSLSGVCHQI